MNFSDQSLDLHKLRIFSTIYQLYQKKFYETQQNIYILNQLSRSTKWCKNLYITLSHLTLSTLSTFPGLSNDEIYKISLNLNNQDIKFFF